VSVRFAGDFGFQVRDFRSRSRLREEHGERVHVCPARISRPGPTTNNRALFGYGCTATRYGKSRTTVVEQILGHRRLRNRYRRPESNYTGHVKLPSPCCRSLDRYGVRGRSCPCIDRPAIVLVGGVPRVGGFGKNREIVVAIFARPRDGFRVIVTPEPVVSRRPLDAKFSRACAYRRTRIRNAAFSSTRSSLVRDSVIIGRSAVRTRGIIETEWNRRLANENERFASEFRVFVVFPYRFFVLRRVSRVRYRRTVSGKREKETVGRVWYSAG